MQQTCIKKNQWNTTFTACCSAVLVNAKRQDGQRWLADVVPTFPHDLSSAPSMHTLSTAFGLERTKLAIWYNSGTQLSWPKWPRGVGNCLLLSADMSPTNHHPQIPCIAMRKWGGERTRWTRLSANVNARKAGCAVLSVAVARCCMQVTRKKASRQTDWLLA